MEVLKIRGGTPLNGEIEVAGSKNAALALFSATPLIDGPITLQNVPEISDADIKLGLLRSLGIEATRDGTTVYLDGSTIKSCQPEDTSVRPIRTSFYLLGPLLARFGKAVLPAPGGCKIGARPVDFHLKGLGLMGAEIEMTGGCYVGSAPDLHGAEIYLDYPSAGATQHMMCTATLADGITTIQNAAMEPEVVSLAGFLNAMGARIEGAGSSTITITGVKRLPGGEYRVPADRMQAGTYLLAAAATQGSVAVTGILPQDQTALVQKLKDAEVETTQGHDWVRVTANARPKGIRVKTMPHPGFPTDLQQPLAAVLATASSPSWIRETIYESRIGHIQELNRMGADLRLQGETTFIEPVPKLKGARVEASDLRAGAALVIAALAAEGETQITNIHFIDRGYARLEETLRSLGADIERVDIEAPYKTPQSSTDS